MKADLSKVGYSFEADMSYNVMPDVVDLRQAERLVGRFLPHRLDHLYKVQALATRWSKQLFADLPLKYMDGWVEITSATALLHEIMTTGKNFEDIATTCTEFVAMGVSAMTPDMRQPKTWRTRLLGNSIGLSPPHIQFVVLADLVQSWQDAPSDSREVLDCLHSIRRNSIVCEELAKLDRDIRQSIGIRPSRKTPK